MKLYVINVIISIIVIACSSEERALNGQNSSGQIGRQPPVSTNPLSPSKPGETFADLVSKLPPQDLEKYIKNASSSGVKFNINAVDRSGETALHSAATGDIERIKILVKNGADINAMGEATNRPGGLRRALVTPLYQALLNHKIENARQLIDLGANPNLGGEIQTPLHLAIEQAHKEKNDNLLDFILTIPTIQLNIEDYFKQTPLVKAVSYGDKALVERLLKAGAKIDAGTERPLQRALREKHAEIATLLITKGADVTHGNSAYDSTYSEQIKANDKTLVKLLISKGASVNSGDIKDALTLQTDHDATEMLSILLPHYKESLISLNSKDNLRASAMSKGYIDAACLLLSKPNDKATNLKRLFMEFRDNVAAITHLIAAGLNLNDPVGAGNEALPPLHYIAWNPGEVAVVDLLVKSGADIHKKVIVSGKAFNDTPLHLAVANSYIGSEIVKKLLALGANPNIQNDEGNTPLHIVVQKRPLSSEHLEAIKLLAPVTNKAIQNKDGNTPIKLTTNGEARNLLK